MATKPPAKKTVASRIVESSGDVFADLGLPKPEQELMKTRLTLEIYRIVRSRRLTQS